MKRNIKKIATPPPKSKARKRKRPASLERNEGVTKVIKGLRKNE